MISETELYDSFLEGRQFLTADYHAPFRCVRNKKRGIIMLRALEDIHAKLMSHDFPFGLVFLLILSRTENLINLARIYVFIIQVLGPAK